MIFRLVPLAAAAFFMITGAYAMHVEEEGYPGIALLAAGLVTLGGWIAIESWSAIEGRRAMHLVEKTEALKKDN